MCVSCVCVLWQCGDSAVVFKNVCPSSVSGFVLARARMCVLCSVWKTNGPKTPETGKKRVKTHTRIIRFYTLTLTFTTHIHTSSSISGSRILIVGGGRGERS